MAQSYLDRFRSTLSSTQGNHILGRLISEKDSGKIRTINEFKDRLKELTTDILEERITPTLSIFGAIGGEDTSSEQYNDMLKRIENDLETAFTEADSIDEIIEAHHNIIDNVALKALRFGVNELESRVTLYEFINRSGKGFDDAQFNTFRESKKLKTARSDQVADLVYIDPRSKLAIPRSSDASVDFLGERLLLGYNQQTYRSVKGVEWLSNNSSIRSELNVAFPNSNIRNVIDNKSNTFWVVPILLSQIRNSGVPLEIYLEMSSVQDVNFIEIEPASNFPMVVSGIDYIDGNNDRRTISNNEVLLDGPTKINFGRITCNGVILRVRQDNYNEVQFTQKRGESNFHKAVLGQSIDTIDVASVSNELREVLSSDFVLTSAIGVNNSPLRQRKFYEYVLGFDNIRVGFGTFREKGVFVGAKKKVLKLGQIGLKVKEIRPTTTSASTDIVLSSFNYPERSSEEDTKFYHGSIEYWVTLQLFTDDDYLIDTLTVPILPLGAERIYHEQLVFTKKSSSSAQNADMSTLMFFTNPNPSDVKVYRNGTILSYGNNPTAGWEFVASVSGQTDTDGNTLQTVDADITNTTPGSIPLKRGIKIWDTVRPLDIYTVSYTPKRSNTRSIVGNNSLLYSIDVSGNNTVRIIDENVLVLDSTRKSLQIDSVNVYLTTIMRRNSANFNYSPILEEYMMVLGSKDQGRFTGDI